ncbi:M28 family peptidase [Sphingomonas sp. G-3-2-10]|uniref:M28 family peptidase n=1 Tax=Sphingomonas sp. G-3-2-10 TaxID=2728838 RepID=UPI00146E00DC|nr:M28 family peptidase [Sphingomonas sp. G-3-2-10]NML05348.1 M28 family peptidase [Sphingomonas sp. G-3-2-10]
MRLFALSLPLLLLAAASAPERKTDPARLSEMVKTLASPEFEGRGPGTPGEEKTVAYLVDRFKALGLEPGGDNGTFVQRVPMVHTKITGGTMAFGGETVEQGKAISVTTVGAKERIAVNAPTVFVGYGVHAPEAGWDDFKGVDLKGKVAVFLINDPDFEALDGEDAKGKFGDRRMTYYGRWTYKFDEAAKRGAVAALIVHDSAGVGYGWSTVTANNGENYDIVRAAGDSKIPLQGWIANEASDGLFARARLDLKALRVQARSASFRPVEMKGVNFTANLNVSVERIQTANVIAKISGSLYPKETVMFGAHWDAYGKAADGTIRPGANDDALGTAGVLELARLFKAAKPPERTMVFALWTGEERGLLGSEYYGSHPLYPLEKTVANLTLDILNTGGFSKNVVLVGNGNSTLDHLLTDAAKLQERVVTPETFSERGLFFRADHFSVARRGVPSLLIMQLGGAPDLREGGTTAGQAWLDGYMKCYHQACDAWDPKWNFAAAAQDVDLFLDMGEQLANSREWPRWRAGFEFENIREASAAARR